MISLYYGGAEQGVWRDLLYENGVRSMSLSFMGLRRRVKRLDRWRLEDKFPGDVRIYLDSGAFTLNRPDSTVTYSEATNLATDYHAFVSANADRLTFASEFDANVLGADTIIAHRNDFWSELPEHSWMPVWHADYGISVLENWSETYERLGILQDDAGTDLTPILNRVASSTMLHGISMTRQDAMEGVRWSSVGSARWLAPSQYGETFVWTGHELKDYPKKYKDTGRLRHRTWLADQGFDTDKIEADDSRELLRLSIWSWLQYVESLNRADAVTTRPEVPRAQFSEQPSPAVDRPTPEVRNETATPPAAAIERPQGRQLLPVVGFHFENVRRLSEDGTPEEVPESRMTTPAEGLMQCDSCFIRTKCPAMQPGHSCAYELPVQIRTPSQIEAVRQSLAEMQMHRVLRMVLFEQTEGGYADPNLTLEMSRAWKMLTDLGVNTDTVKLTLEAGGQAASAGMISRIFGSRAGDRLAGQEVDNVFPSHAIEPTVSTQSVIAEVVEAEIVDERG